MSRARVGRRGQPLEYVAFWVGTDTKQRLEAFVGATHVSLSEALRDAVREYLDNHEEAI